MADLKKVLSKLKETNSNMEEISPEELTELEGGANVACAPKNSSCPTTSNVACG